VHCAQCWQQQSEDWPCRQLTASTAPNAVELKINRLVKAATDSGSDKKQLVVEVSGLIKNLQLRLKALTNKGKYKELPPGLRNSQIDEATQQLETLKSIQGQALAAYKTTSVGPSSQSAADLQQITSSVDVDLEQQNFIKQSAVANEWASRLVTTEEEARLVKEACNNAYLKADMSGDSWKTGLEWKERADVAMDFADKFKMRYDEKKWKSELILGEGKQDASMEILGKVVKEAQSTWQNLTSAQGYYEQAIKWWE
jgi:hypothetical protein